jgi:hypothetical protein
MSQEGEDPQRPDLFEGRYANYFEIGHNAFEFLLDFGQVSPESQRKQFHTRIITGPVYAKALLGILQESIDRYEQAFGAIPQEEK